MTITPFDADALRLAVETAIAYRRDDARRPIPSAITPEEAMRRFGGPLPSKGQSPPDVIAAITRAAEGGLLSLTSPRFFGFVIGGSHPAGVAADVLLSAWGQNSAYAVTTPAVIAMESVAAGWVCDLLGLPPGCGAGFVTGATLANTQGIMAARGELLRRANWDVEGDGLFGAPEIQVMIGAEAHSSPKAALRYAGLGAKRIHEVPADDQGRMDPAAFARILAPLKPPVLVVLQAGHINSGSCDDFARIIPLARDKGAWVHVDGAFGLWLAAVPELAHHTAGVELADSWATDMHKWLNAPYDAGLVLVRDASALTRAMSAPAAYLPAKGAIADPNDSVMELSRRARGVPSYAILRTLGAEGTREIIARTCALARQAADQISALPGLKVMNEVVANQVAFRAGEGPEGDALTRALLARVQARGRVYPSHGHWKGREIIRISVSGYTTTEDDIAILSEELRFALGEVRT